MHKIYEDTSLFLLFSIINETGYQLFLGSKMLHMDFQLQGDQHPHPQSCSKVTCILHFGSLAVISSNHVRNYNVVTVIIGEFLA